MLKEKVLINSVEKAKEFVNIASKIEEPIDLCSEGRYVVDGRSILGIFSLNLIDPMEMTIGSDDRTILGRFSDFLVPAVKS